MLYKPKYCCNCGEEIERIEWFPWTSGRFCEICETRYKIQEWIPRLFVAFGLLLSIFGLGTYLKSGEKHPPVAVKQNTTDTLKTAQNPSNQKIVSQMSANAQTLLSPSVANQIKSDSQTPKARAVQTENAPKEVVYFCGAQTKKGTPCSRRVKNGGRCWQHLEQPAMLPPEKLIASQ